MSSARLDPTRCWPAMAGRTWFSRSGTARNWSRACWSAFPSALASSPKISEETTQGPGIYKGVERPRRPSADSRQKPHSRSRRWINSHRHSGYSSFSHPVSFFRSKASRAPLKPLLQHRPAPLAGLVLPGQGESVFLVEMPRRVQSGEGVEMDLAEPGPAAEIHGRSQQAGVRRPGPGLPPPG